MRGLRFKAVVALTALLSVACGARVKPYLGGGEGTQGAGGSTSIGSGSSTLSPGASLTGPGTQQGSQSPGQANGGPNPAPSGSGGTVPGSGQQTGPSAPGANALASLTPANFPFTPAGQAALCQGNAGNTASDTGVTPATITFGNVSGLTGVLANNFNQGPEAVQAVFAAVNAAGGICGRQLKLSVEDDGQDSTKNAADVQDLLPRVFAFVGSLSDGDNGGVPEMVQAHAIDDGAAINANRGEAASYWSPAGATQYVVNGHPEIYNSLTNGLKAAGNFPSKIATLAYSIPISSDAAKEFNNLFDQAGAKTCFTDYSISPASTGLDSDVVQMKNNGCTGVYTTMDVTGNAKLLQAMQRQNFNPPYKGTTFDGYTPALISVAGQSASQNMEANLPFAPFTDHNTIVNEYLQQLQTYEPGKSPSGFGLLSWAGAEMMIYGLLKAGRNPTKASVVAAFNAIQTWDTGGATAPITPNQRRPAGPCTMDVQVKGSDFFRKWPSSGFFCTGSLVVVG